jgi:hypothetical protein
MSQVSGSDLINDVTPGDIISVDRGSGERPYKVVFKDSTDTGYVVTFEDDDGETFQLELAAGTAVKRSLESKWESAQSPTPHSEA